MKHELTFKNHANGLKVAQILLDEDYVVMLSYEEDLLVINWLFSHGSDRNNAVFMPRDEYEEEWDKCGSEVYEDIRIDIKSGYIKDLSDI